MIAALNIFKGDPGITEYLIHTRLILKGSGQIVTD